MLRRLLIAALSLSLPLISATADDPPAVFFEPLSYFVPFDSNSDTLTDEAKVVIGQAIQDFDMNNTVIMNVVGHYDTSATEEYADQMSRKMAESVRDCLVAGGVPPTSIRIDWRGEREPAIPIADGVASSANRRVDIYFSKN